MERTPGREKLGGTAEEGYLHCGSSGAGHFVKMVHNGIEYGLMAAFGEGFDILASANASLKKGEADAETAPVGDDYVFDINLADVAEVWRRGSVVSSWLLDLVAAAFAENPTLSNFSGRVSDSGEGRWTIMAAIDEAVRMRRAERRALRPLSLTQGPYDGRKGRLRDALPVWRTHRACSRRIGLPRAGRKRSFTTGSH